MNKNTHKDTFSLNIESFISEENHFPYSKSDFPKFSPHSLKIYSFYNKKVEEAENEYEDIFVFLKNIEESFGKRKIFFPNYQHLEICLKKNRLTYRILDGKSVYFANAIYSSKGSKENLCMIGLHPSEKSVFCGLNYFPKKSFPKSFNIAYFE